MCKQVDIGGVRGESTNDGEEAIDAASEGDGVTKDFTTTGHIGCTPEVYGRLSKNLSASVVGDKIENTLHPAHPGHFARGCIHAHIISQSWLCLRNSLHHDSTPHVGRLTAIQRSILARPLGNRP